MFIQVYNDWCSSSDWVIITIKKLYGPSLRMGFNCLKTTEQPRGDSLLFTLSPYEFLVLIWSTAEEWKAKLTLDPPNGFQP